MRSDPEETNMSVFGPFSIHGKTAVITGGAMGIGFGIASRFMEGGANVLLADVNERALAAAMDKLAAAEGRIVPFVSDIGSDSAPQAIVSRCVDEFGGLDILVNNAGIFPQIPILKMSAGEFDRVYRINLRGLVFLSQAAGRQMVQQGRGGAIVNIASVDSLHPSMVGLGAYDASKGGVWMFTKSFALEMAPHHVRVNAIAPGPVRTEGTSKPLAGSGMTAEQMRELMEKLVTTKVPLGRMGAPDDIALAAVFLASQASAFTTGSLLVVDGGMLLT
jgi:2-deoxy-D-gluconate 3-dehydrogenase